MHQEEDKLGTPYFKIDQNGMMDVVGDFNPETLADILFIIKQPDFLEKTIKYLSQKFAGTEFEERFMKRIEVQSGLMKIIEEAFVHPLQSWKGLNEN